MHGMNIKIVPCSHLCYRLSYTWVIVGTEGLSE